MRFVPRSTTLIRSGEYKVTHFQRELGISSSSYGNFMKLKGPLNGTDNQTYKAAHKFFLERGKHPSLLTESSLHPSTRPFDERTI